MSDEKKRAQYDQFGHAAFDGAAGAGGAGGFGGFDFSGFGGAGGGMEDIFDMFFGGGGRSRGGRQAGPQRGSDLRFDMEITFEEAAFGVEREINLTRDEQCPKCKGSGAEPGSKVETCPECHGTGQVSFTQNTMFGRCVTCARAADATAKAKLLPSRAKNVRAKAPYAKPKSLKLKFLPVLTTVRACA